MLGDRSGPFVRSDETVQVPVRLQAEIDGDGVSHPSRGHAVGDAPLVRPDVVLNAPTATPRNSTGFVAVNRDESDTVLAVRDDIEASMLPAVFTAVVGGCAIIGIRWRVDSKTVQLVACTADVASHSSLTLIESADLNSSHVCHAKELTNGPSEDSSIVIVVLRLVKSKYDVNLVPVRIIDPEIGWSASVAVGKGKPDTFGLNDVFPLRVGREHCCPSCKGGASFYQRFPYCNHAEKYLRPSRHLAGSVLRDVSISGEVKIDNWAS
jgi:hypothetical protein